MTVGELISMLEQLPQHLDVCRDSTHGQISIDFAEIAYSDPESTNPVMVVLS